MHTLPDLRPTQPGHLLDVTPLQSPRRLPLTCVFLLEEHRLHPAVYLLPVFALKTDRLAGRYQHTNLLQTQLLGLVHADLQSSA